MNPNNIAPFHPTTQDQNQADPSVHHIGQSQKMPTQAAFTVGIAREILNDMLDEDQQLFVAAGLITTLILLFWRRMSHQITKRTAAKVIETLREEGVIQSQR